MDIVYICRNGDNEELRYSIRSVVKNLKHDNLWVVGGRPNWYTGKYIAVEQNARKYDNARNNLRAICLEDKISEDFILMNDDFFILKPMDSIEVWHGGSLKEKCSRRKRFEPYSDYTRHLIKTHKDLSMNGYDDPLDYELHTPLPVTKTALAEALDMPGLWRSIIGNKLSLGGIENKDIKLYSKDSPMYRDIEEIIKTPYASTSERLFPLMLKLILSSEFPDRSEYEA